MHAATGECYARQGAQAHDGEKCWQCSQGSGRDGGAGGAGPA